ncbi:general stress protein [Sulfurovum sp. NBC37-1]|uniref:general stress protein n=1 Tax=Sulfurovum sp. (strain NBC37-1) TaxID=387093 RepID=UPI0001587481|nr:general stress protein [Sulfurovum sp. NBC37-1]BAF71756.1 conserved hypothetical protein [Sulfurovum sp. NBC37-1]
MTKEKIVAVYDSEHDAMEALKALQEAKISKDDISVIGKGDHDEPKVEFEIERENEDIVRWGKEGVFWGAVLGSMTGAFFFWVPGFGPLVAAGSVISSLAGALGGAATIGSVAALTAWFVDIGIEEAEAHRYTDLMKEGKVLLIVKSGEKSAETAKEVLEKLGKGEVKLYAAK